MKYFRPNNIDELQDILYNEKESFVSILAGGTDLIPKWENNLNAKPHILIDIKKLGDYSGIREKDNKIIIGALTTIQEIKNSPLLQNEFPALTDAAGQFAGVQIRHRATIGGNICNASPAGDLIPGLYAHEAELYLLGPGGRRSLPISQWMVGPGKTVLEKDEIVSEIHIQRTNEKSLFYKLGLRQSMAIAVINFAIAYSKDSDNAFTSLNISAGSVAPTVVYLRSFADAILQNVSLEKALPLVDEDISPIDDIRATANYRRTVLKNVLKYTFRHECHELSE